MNILVLAAEVGPFVSVGGLSQVMYFLPKALRQLGHDVRMFTPKFGAMDKTSPTKKGWRLAMQTEGLHVPLDHANASTTSLVCNVKTLSKTKHNVTTYFLENREYYELRANVFGYKDDHTRFLLLCKGCLEWLIARREKIKKSKHDVWWPDVIHCNDWHASYFIELARSVPRYKEILDKVPIVLTVHNFKYQGNYDFQYCEPKDRDSGSKPLEPLLSEKLIKQNVLLRGLVYADAITTVSPTHAREIQTTEYAEGLGKTLLQVKGKMSGILNGLDTEEFNPKTDPLLFRQFSPKHFETARRLNKKYVQQEFSLPVNPDAFVVAYSGRLVQQKGVGLLLEALPHLLKEYADMQFVVLGGGDDTYRFILQQLRTKFPKQIGLHLLPNFQLPHVIFSGADALLMPSLFEPGGIVALEGLRYGSVPIVRRTGGLSDIVTDFDPETHEGNGFSFTAKNAWGLYGSVVKAVTTYRNKKLWKKLVENCLECDFSWTHAAKEYERWYRKAIALRKRYVAKKPSVQYM